MSHSAALSPPALNPAPRARRFPCTAKLKRASAALSSRSGESRKKTPWFCSRREPTLSQLSALCSTRRTLSDARANSPASFASMTSRNDLLFERSRRIIPGGVNSPVRAFRAVGGTPPFVERGEGSRIWDADGREYIDYVCSWGPLVLGHADPEVVAAVRGAAARGLSFGAPTESEAELAELLGRLVPGLELVRLVSSGTEATMSALRLARGATGRSLIVKFEGCYHGHADSLLVKAGSGALTLGHPSSAGVPAETAAHTVVLDYNDAGQVRSLFETQGEQIAAVIVEPVAGNMNLVLPAQGFLEGLREQCTRHGAVLIFDEVMTGF